MTQLVKGLSYAEWMKRVNFRIIKKTGMDADMLPDYCYMDCWRLGDTPEEAADDAIEYARDF